MAASLVAAALLAGCGSSSPAAANVRASYGRLLQALASDDAVTVCELMLPFGQDQPRSALTTAAHTLATPSAAAAYRRYIASSCVPEFLDKPANIRGYRRLFGGSRLGSISFRGPIATATVTSRSGRHGTATFVHAAVGWRIVIGIE